jgi:hypothetical protein
MLLMQDKYKIFLSNELPALLIFLPPFKEDLDCLFTGSNPASAVYPPFVKTEKFIKK